MLTPDARHLINEVPFVDLDRQHAPLMADIEAAMAAVVARGDFILGAAVEAFEEDFAAFTGVAHAVGVGSGTAALTIALRAAGIGPGDEVIVPAHTFIATALGVVHAGATPVFCDVVDATGLLDFAAAGDRVTPQTAAVIPVHLYGQVCAMDEAEAFADRHGLALIEDAAQAHGARWDGRRAGSFGRAGAFSFYPSKNLGAFGDGGIICTDDAELAAAARSWRNLGQLHKGEHLRAGFNERLDTIQAAVLACKLPNLDAWNSSRREAAGWYRDRLDGVGAILPDRELAEDVFHLFPIRFPDRDRVAAALAEQGIGTGIHYTPAAHAQPPFQSAGAGAPPGGFPVAEAWASEELSLPMFAGMTEDEVETVAVALDRVVAREDLG